jgi:hypothetical protein
MSKVSFIDSASQRQELDIAVEDYREAGDLKMSLSQLYEMKYPSDPDLGCSTFEQMCASAGIRVRPDPARGIGASSMKEIIYGSRSMVAQGPITRPSGESSNTPSSRLLFPQVIMNLVEASLIDNKDHYLAPWENAIALRTTVSAARVDQPKIDTTSMEDGDSYQPIAQLAEPANMTRITLSDISYAIPTKAIGLEISDQALQATTIDLVAISLASQARIERIKRLETDMQAMISGDIDTGVVTSPIVNASTYDPAINAGLPITQLGFSKFLRANSITMNMTHMIMDDDTFLALEGRPGVVSVLTAPAPNQAGPGAVLLANASFPTPQALILPSAIVGANVILGFDSSKALHQITNQLASYTAIENFVLRRAVSFRWDYGSLMTKLHDDAWSGMLIGA